MAQYTNLTLNSNDWELYFQLSSHNKCLVVLVILFYGLKIQLQKLNQQRNVNLIKEFKEGVVHMIVTVMNWCAYMQDYNDTVMEKCVVEAQVTPYKNKTAVKPERREENKHPWDIAKEMMAEQKQAVIAIKWAILPLETLMDEQFLVVLHAIEEITDITPLREASLHLPKKIYEIVKIHEQLTRVPAELTDQLVYDVSKTYYYSIIESLCKLVRSIQQGQRTTLISLARIIQDQKEEIEKYQTLLELPREMRQLWLGMEMKMEQLKKHVNTHLERLDKKTTLTSVTISEVRSQIHRLENTMEDHLGHMPEPDNPSWVFPGDIVHLNAPEDYTTFHDQGNNETPLNTRQHQEEHLASDEEVHENHDNTPHGLSPVRNYIPAGAEGGETSSSASIHNGEEKLEEELENYFNNPSYRASVPPPLVPIDSDEDWRDTSPVPFPSQAPREPPQPATRFEKRQRYLQKRRERRRQGWWERNPDQNPLNH